MRTKLDRSVPRVLGVGAVCAYCGGPVAAADPVPVDGATVFRTEQFLMHSENVGEDFRIQVAEPLTLAPLAPDQRFPVVYVTDGGILFHRGSGNVNDAARFACAAPR